MIDRHPTWLVAAATFTLFGPLPAGITLLIERLIT